MKAITKKQNGVSTQGRGVRTGGRIRRLVGALALGLVLAGGTAPMFAQPASAASGIGYCFRHSGGGAYTYDTYLELWSNNQWVRVTNLGRSVNGCHNITISGAWRSYPARAVAYYRLSNGYTYFGATPYWAPAGTYTYNLGTGYVNN